MEIHSGLDFLLYAIGIISFTILLFLIMREFVTWYWKINRIVELLEMIEENTRPKEINEQLKREQGISD